MAETPNKMGTNLAKEIQDGDARISHFYTGESLVLNSGSCKSLRMNFTYPLSERIPFSDLPFNLEVARREASLAHKGPVNRSLIKLADDLVLLANKGLLNKLENIVLSDGDNIISWDENISFCQSLDHLPKLRFLTLRANDSFTNTHFLALLGNKSLESLDMIAPIGKMLNDAGSQAELKNKIESCTIKHFFFQSCGITDEIVEVLSQNTSLITLDITDNLEISSRALKAIAQNSSISSLSLSYNAKLFEGILALIKANRLQFLFISTDEFKGPKLTKEQCEILDQAFQENTSLLKVIITNRNAIWPETTPCSAFKLRDKATEEEVEIKFVTVPNHLPNKVLFLDFFEIYSFGLRNFVMSPASQFGSLGSLGVDPISTLCLMIDPKETQTGFSGQIFLLQQYCKHRADQTPLLGAQDQDLKSRDKPSQPTS